MNTPTHPGKIRREAHVECGAPGCNAHDYAPEPSAARRFARLGWRRVHRLGWVCPDHAPKPNPNGYV